MGLQNTANSSQKTRRKLFQNENCFKFCPMHTVEFPTEEGKLQKSGFKKITQKSTRKLLTYLLKWCPYQAERKPITSRVKSVQKPMEAPTFLSLIEIDLMDFRKCPCDCKESHTWVLNVTDHHTKHVALYPLTAKCGEKVLDALQQHCHTYGYPKKNTM